MGGTAAAAAASRAPDRSAASGMVDADLHNVVPSTQALFPYLPAHWREHITNTLFKGPVDSAYPKNAPTTARPGSAPGDGRPAGSDLGLLQQQALDPLGVAVGILC